MQYNPPTGSGDANAPYVGKNVAAGTQGSKVPPGAIEFVQREIVAAIAASGQSPSNSDLSQLLKTFRTGALGFYVDTGSADALAIASNPAFTTVPVGTVFTILKSGAGNATTTPTLTVNGNPPVVIKKADNSALGINDLPGACIFSARWDGASYRAEGLRKSDVTVPNNVHSGDDSSSSSSQLLVTNLSPAMPANVDKQVVIVGTQVACPGGAMTMKFSSGGTAYPITAQDGSNLGANDYPQFDRPVFVGDGTRFRLVATVAQVLRLAQSSTTINTTTQSYIDKSTPRGSTKLSAFTANVVASDIAVTPAFTTVQMTGNFSGATYVDASSTCALHDNASTGNEGSGTARVALNDVTAGTTSYSNYVGGGGFSQGIQVALVCPRVIFNLNPAHTYNLSLVCQKGSSVGQTQIFDTYIFAQHDGTNS